MLCKNCEKEFNKVANSQKYCSIKCRNKFWGNDYYQKNKHKISKRHKTEEYRERERAYKKLPHIKKQRRIYLQKKRKTDPIFRLKHSIADRIRGDKRFRKIFKIKDIEQYLGYKIDDLLNYLQATMPYNYTMDDYLCGKLWIDHIIPYYYYIISELGDEEFKKCWNFKNLRLLPKNENIKKNSKVDWFEISEELYEILPKGPREILL